MDLTLDLVLRGRAGEFVMLDSDLRITGVSEHAARFADDPSSARVGEDVRLSFPELFGVETDLQEVLLGIRPSLVIRGIDRSRDENAPLFVTITATPSRNRPSAPPSLLLVLEDVTDWMEDIRRRTQTSNDAMLLMHAMAASKAFVDNIFDAMADLLIVTSPKGIINAVNRATLSVTEYRSPELIGRPITLLLPDEKLSDRLDISWQTAPAELTCVAKSGTTIPVSFTRAPLDAGEHVLLGVVYLGRDLREQRKAEARISKLETENLSLHEVLSTSRDDPEIVWTSPPMNALMKDLKKVAVTDTTVLITGETGTGKELVARELHRLSTRNKSLLVTVNCAALPAGLVESELFGHEKGAFTGALQRRIGRFEVADGGTVFLDEIGELPLSTQATLLRVLQEQTFERVGGSHAIRINTRVIAATNRDLNEEVREGRFREDLLFRLNVFPLHVPALRERPEEIPLLVEHFMRLFARRTNKRITSVDPKAMRVLMEYSWPGNVRELANVIEHAMIVCEGNTLVVGQLGLVQLPQRTGNHKATFDDMARQHLLRTLEDCGGIIEGPHGAAAVLGLKPATLRSRIKKLGIVRSGGGFQAGS